MEGEGEGCAVYTVFTYSRYHTCTVYRYKYLICDAIGCCLYGWNKSHSRRFHDVEKGWRRVGFFCLRTIVPLCACSFQYWFLNGYLGVLAPATPATVVGATSHSCFEHLGPMFYR